MNVLLLSLLFSGLVASIGHLIWGDHPAELAWFWFLSFAGFLAGHFVGVNADFPLPTLGELHIVPASVGSTIGVVIANSIKV
ncbi:MAG: hypothetical protein Q9O62_08125 [Ardenticatenia bacterium]|nr:hypothetical protein [Ardenticatenia bacterium]